MLRPARLVIASPAATGCRWGAGDAGDEPAHCAAAYYALSGDNRGDTFVNFGAGPNDHPGLGAVLSRLRPPEGPIERVQGGMNVLAAIPDGESNLTLSTSTGVKGERACFMRLQER